MTINAMAGRLAGVLALTLSLLGGAPGVAEAKVVVIKKSTVYIAALPRGCVRTTYNGNVVVWKCGALYYQPYNGRYVRVYIR